MDTITWQDFTAVELRVGTILTVEDFPQARNPAYIITVDFGDELGIRKTSAQITTLYGKDDLVGRQIVGVVNFPAKQVGPVRSEFLLTGFYADDREVVIAIPERPVPNGAKLL
jgi:tRNA-binding protein